jgi:hypothetical protein
MTTSVYIALSFEPATQNLNRSPRKKMPDFTPLNFRDIPGYAGVPVFRGA